MPSTAPSFKKCSVLFGSLRLPCNYGSGSAWERTAVRSWSVELWVGVCVLNIYGTARLPLVLEARSE